MKASPKRKQELRLARQADRDYAAALAREYRERKAVALRLGNGKRASRFVPMTGADLANELEFFARHGTWQREDKARRNELIREWFASLRSQGVTYPKAVDATAEHWGEKADLVRSIVDDRKAKTVAPS